MPASLRISSAPLDVEPAVPLSTPTTSVHSAAHDPPSHHRGWLDMAGIAVSVLCAIHCAASGLFIAALALLGVGDRLPDWLEWAFLGTSLVVGAAALGRGHRCHGNRRALRLFVGGATVLILARVAGAAVQSVEPLLVVVGAGAIVLAHARNWRDERRCHHLASNATPACAAHAPHGH